MLVFSKVLASTIHIAKALAVLSSVTIAVCAPAKADVMWGANGHPLVSYPGTTIEQQLAYLKDLGMKSYRVDVNNIRQSARLGQLITAAKVHGIEILPVLIPPADLANESPEVLYRKSYEFAFTMIERFKADVRVWELGNELENFAIITACEMQDDGVQYNCEWGPAGGVGPLEYYGPRWAKVSAVLKGLSDAAIAVDPTIRKAMGTAGWGHTGAFDRMQQDGIQWDISVWHIYSQDPTWAFEKLAKFNKPIWITELNHGYGSQKGEKEQADGLKALMIKLQHLQAKFNIEAAHIYELMDETYWAPHFEAYMGLVRLEKNSRGGWKPGGPKPAYDAARELIRGPNAVSHLSSSGDPLESAAASENTPQPLAAAPSIGRVCDLRAFSNLPGTTRNKVYLSYCLVLGRLPDGRGLSDWSTAFSKERDTGKILQSMLGSDEFRTKYSTDLLTNTAYVTLMYRLLLDRDPDGRGLQDYTDDLDSGKIDRTALAGALVSSDEFRAKRPSLFADMTPSADKSATQAP